MHATADVTHSGLSLSYFSDISIQPRRLLSPHRTGKAGLTGPLLPICTAQYEKRHNYKGEGQWPNSIIDQFCPHAGTESALDRPFAEAKAVL